MNHSPFHRLLLPASLAFSVSFAAMTGLLLPQILAAASIRPANADANYKLIDSQRDLANRYVGLAIITGVICGLTTFEGLRRWYQFHEAAHLKAEELGLLPLLQEPAGDEALSTSDPMMVMDLELSALMTNEPLHQLDTSHDSTDNGHGSKPAILQDFPIAADDMATVPILESRQQYQICRIQLADLERHWLGLVVNDRYYRFIRTESSRQTALKKADRLQQTGQSALVTTTQRGYAVWVWEPYAYLSYPADKSA